ncbi:MAG: phosphate acyltransferase PlsX, partial [Oceanococcus sp.]
ALKSAEGISRLIGDYLAQEYRRNLFSKFAALMSFGVLKRFRQRVDPRSHNGASLLGLNGIVIKSHGSADALSFANAINIAVLESRKQIIATLAVEVEAHLQSPIAAPVI